MIFSGGPPDPSKIIYETTAPPRFPSRMSTRSAAKLYPIHDHCVFVDGAGNGATDTVASHFHRVRDHVLLPDESDGHTHAISRLPCGAG